MKYKLFISDFDGTLVHSDGTISARTKEAIARYTAAGGIFAVCTGRMLRSILPRLKELGIEEGLVVAYQGAMIADIKSGKLLKDEGFAFEDALKVIRLLEADGQHIHVYADDILYSNRDDELLRIYEKICGVKGEVAQELLSDMVAAKRMNVTKILAMTAPDVRDGLREKLSRALGEGFFVTTSSEWLVEVMPAGQSKASAVDFLSEYYKVPHGDIAAIGDQLNDLPMLQRAGGKFAVKNGETELKVGAIEVPSNDDDGVAFAIENYVFGVGHE